MGQVCMPTNQRILVIDDEVGVGQFIRDVADGMSISCVATQEPEAFFRGLTSDTTLIMLDLLMPQMDGIELLRLLAAQGSRVPLVLMSGVGKRVMESAEQVANSLGLTVVGHLAKPFRLKELEDLLRQQIDLNGPRVERTRTSVAVTEEELRAAIAEEQFVVHYQPQVDLATNRVVGIESLVRWRHPERGVIYPDEFIGPLESMGLIDELGWIVARRGLEEMKQVVVSGKPPVLSLNVSVFSLRDLRYTDRFMAMLRDAGIGAERVMLEITESGLIKELSSTLDVLTRLRMKQVRLSIDDFGTGYAMMQQLRVVPATELKIDKSFVQNMHVSDSDRVMVQKTIEIGHELGMVVVAEGVETLEQLEFLRGSGCDVVQGYLFSRPLPMEQLVGWVKRHEGKEVGSRD
jgi:EAL domain-containing protein (putative c-di-GMP-specific phosphodiesterase class I)